MLGAAQPLTPYYHLPGGRQPCQLGQPDNARTVTPSRPVTWLGPETSLRAEVWGQYSPDRLPAIEEFHLGGREDERGYVFAEAQGDSGLSATVELGRDLFPASGPAEYLRGGSKNCPFLGARV